MSPPSLIILYSAGLAGVRVAQVVVKCKAIPVTGLFGLEGSGRLRLQISRHSAHEGGKVFTLTYRPPLPPGISWLSRPQGTRKCQLPQNKFQVSPSGIDPGPFRLVAQRLNHYAVPGPNAGGGIPFYSRRWNNCQEGGPHRRRKN